MWLWCHEIASFPDLRVRDESRNTALGHVFLNMATRTRTQVWISAEVLLIHTWVRVRVSISLNTGTHAVSRVTGLVPRRTRNSGNETTFTNIIRPPGSLPQAVPLVNQNIKLVWPYLERKERFTIRQYAIAPSTCTVAYRSIA